MNAQACLFQNQLWVVDSVDQKTGNLIIMLLGSSRKVTVDAADVDFVNAQEASSVLKEQVDKRKALHDIDTDNVSQKRIDDAKKRYETITKELEGQFDAKTAAEKCELSLSRYHEIKRLYNPEVGVRSLLGQARGRKVGTKKISSEVEQVIVEQFTLWFRGESASRRNVWKGVQAACHEKGIPKPAYETVCDRIDEFSKRDLARAQYDKGYASDHFDLRPGTRKFLRPLEQAQMDHTLADCFLVSKDNPDKPIGRPWITTIICSRTKVVLGFYVSFRYPSLGSVALALKHAVTSKEAFMKRLGLSDHPYPYRGVMVELLMDNAREFKSMNLYNACMLENITPRYRKQKQDGGIGERFFGTQNIGIIHILPGGTAARPRKDRGYDPAKHALLTLERFIRELTLGICEYHDTPGGEDNKSPRQRWEEDHMDEDGLPTAPAPVHDLMKFVLEILPEVRPRVSTSGVQVNTIFYFTPLLKDYVGKKLRVKYDNANLSTVAILIAGEWVEARAKGSPPETLTELHLQNAHRAKKGELGDRGIAARLERTESLKEFDAQAAAIAKAKELVEHERQSGTQLLTRQPAPPPRQVMADRRDFTVVVGAYPGEDDL